MTIPLATDSLAAIALAALALPSSSRAVLADLLLSSLDSEAGKPATHSELPKELSVEEMAQRLTAHFYDAKKAALERAAAIAQGGLDNAAQK